LRTTSASAWRARQAQDRLLVAHSELEQRVTSRTRELAQANAELLSQIGERLRAEQQLTYQARHDAPDRTSQPQPVAWKGWRRRLRGRR
jgi:C4-dicarboxylate-specific signal transduction histidine kinase